MHILRFRRRWRWLVLGLIGLMLLGVASWMLQPHLPPLLPSTPTVAQIPGATGALAYRRERDNRLIITELAGGTPRATILVAEGWRSTWSPNGQQLAFTGATPGSDGARQGGLFTIALADAQPQRRSLLGSDAVHWSPDGQTIAFTGFPRDDAVFLLDVASDRVDEVAIPQATELGNLAWSPDSQYLAFHATNDQDPEWQLILLERRTRQIRRLTTGVSPSWAPDSAQLVYVRQGDLYTVAITGGRPTRLTNTPEAEWAPYWAPSGQTIAFLGQDDQLFGEPAWEDIPIGIYRLDLATQAIMPLTGSDTHVLTLAGWSPDGTMLAAVATVGGFPNRRSFGVYLIGADGSGVQLVDPDGDDPAWRP